MIVVKPETVIRWHKKGFKLSWEYNSRKRGPGRSPVDLEMRKIIENMAKENQLWGAPRILGELMKLGIDNISERTISNIIRKYRKKPSSQAWQTFLHNHMLKYLFHRSLYDTNSNIQNPVRLCHYLA